MACCLLGALVVSQILAAVHFIGRRGPRTWLLAGGIAMAAVLTGGLLVRDLQAHPAHAHARAIVVR